jgi:predicted phage terminase large subunit-like protein
MDVPVRIEPNFHPGQLEVKNSPARFKIVVAGRRWGKTRLGITECLEVALEGGRAWWIAPDYKVSGEGWVPLSYICRKYGKEICTVRETDKEVRFVNGGRIEVRTADDPQRLVGAGLDLVVMDEAAKVKPAAWFESLRPALSDKLGKAIFIGTPKGHNWFFELYEAAEKNPDRWARFQFTSLDNPHFPESEWIDSREDMGALLFSQEHEAQFIQPGGTIFDPEWFKHYIPRSHADGYPQYVLPSGEVIDGRETTRYCTVDPAVSVKDSADYTVIMSFAVWKQWILVLDVVRGRMEGPRIVPTVEGVMDDWDLDSAHFERVAFQLALIQEARAKGLAAKELRADKDKLSRALPAAARMEAGQVLWPKDADWAERLQLELQLFTGAQKEHDDQVDALAYGVRVAAGLKRTRVDGVWPDVGRRVSPNKI